MKGSILHDAMILAGTIILIFVIIYWSIDTGAVMIKQALYSAPKTIQDYSANAISVASFSKGFETTLQVSPTAFKLILTSDMINVVPQKELGVLSGVGVKYKTVNPQSLVYNKDVIMVTEESEINKDDSKISVERNDNFIEMGVE